MSGKRKKSTRKEERAAWQSLKEQQRLQKLSKAGKLEDCREIPKDAIAANLSEQPPNNSYSPKYYYQDIEFTCADCGVQEVWKARDQKWYYEVVKGPIYSQPKRCRACRKKVREAKAEQRTRMEAARRPQTEGEHRSK